MTARRLGRMAAGCSYLRAILGAEPVWRLRWVMMLMRFGYIKLADETQFTYSELRDDFTCTLYVEKPVDMGFASAECLLPAMSWSKIEGFSQAEMSWLTEFAVRNAPMVMRLAGEKAEVAAGA